MKHLDKFYNYIIENNSSGFEFDIVEIKEDMLSPIVDLGIDVKVEKVNIISDDYNKGLEIVFDLSKITKEFHLERNHYLTSINKMIDEVVWSFLDEIITFKNRIVVGEITNCLFNIRKNNEDFAFILTLVGPKRTREESLLKELFLGLEKSIQKFRTPFGNNTSVYYEEGGILTLKTWSYNFSDRNLKNIINRSINLQKLSFEELEITTDEIKIGANDAIETTIKIKKK